MQNKINITEHQHQVTVVEWCDLMARHKYPMLKWIYAVPNGGDRHKAVAAKLKAEGVKPGVPDLCLPFPKPLVVDSYPEALGVDVRPGWHGLYIEMKSKDTKGRVSPEQKEWLEYLEFVGYKVGVAWNADQAIQILEDYIGKPSTSP